MPVCVGTGFVVNADGSLGLNGPRAGVWPYAGGSCTAAAVNGLRLDTATGNLWVEPVDLRIPVTSDMTQSGSISLSTTTQTPGTTSWNVTNPDPCRPALLVGTCAFSFSVSLIGSGQIPKVRADVFTGSPPSVPALNTLTPRWQEQNGTVNAGYIQTITLPFQVSIAAGATMGVQMAIGAENSASAGTFSGGSWAYRAALFTQRSVY